MLAIFGITNHNRVANNNKNPILKGDTNPNMVKPWDGDEQESGHSVAVDADGVYVSGQSTYGSSDGYDAILIAYDKTQEMKNDTKFRVVLSTIYRYCTLCCNRCNIYISIR